MPHSLRVKIKNLQRKGIITDKDCDRLITALDNMDTLDKIKAEIADIYCGQYCENPYTAASIRKMALDIIDKYRAESEDEE